MDFLGDGLPGRILKARMDYGMRQERMVSQIECAEKAGVTGPAWSAWESGRNEPDLRTLEKIARVLGVRFAWLVCGDGGIRPLEEFPDVAPLTKQRKILQEEDTHRRKRG